MAGDYRRELFQRALPSFEGLIHKACVLLQLYDRYSHVWCKVGLPGDEMFWTEAQARHRYLHFRATMQ